jgi:hypothetical protein
MHCDRCGMSPATATVLARTAFCASCADQFATVQRENGARIVMPMGVGAVVLATGGTIFPLLNLPGLALVGVVAAFVSAGSFALFLDVRAKRKFASNDKAKLPTAHNDARRLIREKLAPRLPKLPSD